MYSSYLDMARGIQSINWVMQNYLNKYNNKNYMES